MGGAIPADDQAARDLPPQVLQERAHLRRVESAVLTMARPRPRRGDGTAGREMVAGVPLAQDGRLAPWGIGAHDTGQGRTPGFVYEEDGLLLGCRPLLRAGQVSSRQRGIAASSRWRARRMGLCGLQRSAWQRRPTGGGWEVTPNSERIMTAMRPRVQTCPRKPYASGPRRNSSGRCASCASESRRGAPGGGRCRRVSGPPSRARFIHWLTAPSLTPRASAIWRWAPPLCLSCQACNRRAAFQ